ncbi:MAG: Mevalonate kinase [Candidatus Thorarchaeota archaeon]|nr:MAG: Mevalonate kinase [Candidatus Thorarchaeota archaeon]
MGQGAGFGKSILFGEHFVVYGLPAIAAGISSKTIAIVSRKDSPGWTLDDSRPAMPGYKEKKLDEQKVSIDNVIRFCGIDLSEEGIHIELKGDLVCASGIGASAANCVALARALNDEYNLDFDDEKINEAGYEGEKGYHGTPSGIDNTASTFGGLVWFVRDLEGGPPTFERIKLDRPAYLVIASTGLTASTKEVVGDVRAKKEENPEWFDKISREYDEIVQDAKDALIDYDMNKVGKLMNRNHELLQEITVSCQELDRLVKIARENGAIGAKMTGTGRGGNMIALAPDRETQERIKEALEENGAAGAWIATFGL